jgi:hypothetical protein
LHPKQKRLLLAQQKAEYAAVLLKYKKKAGLAELDPRELAAAEEVRGEGGWCVVVVMMMMRERVCVCVGEGGRGRGGEGLTRCFPSRRNTTLVA